MGLFGGSKSSSASTNTTTTYNENLQAQGPAILGEGNALTLISTDQGAVGAGLMLGNNALGINAKALESGFILSKNSQDIAANLTLGLLDKYTAATSNILDRAISSAESQGKEARDFTLQATKSESQAISERLINTGGLIAAIIAVAFILKA